MAFDRHLAVPVDGGPERLAVLHAADQKGRPAVDEALGQAFVQGVRQPVLDGAGAVAPMAGVVQPVVAEGDIGPGADVGDALHQGLDVAVGAVDASHMRGHPVGG